MNTIKDEIVKRLKEVGAFDVKVADPGLGFERTPQKDRPLALWEDCKSVIVFAVAMSPACNNIYLGPRAPGLAFRNVGPVPEDIQSESFAMDRLSRLFVASIIHKGMKYLTDKGYAISFKQPPLKISAFESGLGVYGRSGLILHPVLGNRMSLGVILTDAPMEPDPRLEGYAPCEDCDRCLQMCPAGAFDPDKPYPEGWSRERCTEKRIEIARKGYYCHNCFAVCPAGQVGDRDLLNIRNSVNFSKRHRFQLHYADETRDD